MFSFEFYQHFFIEHLRWLLLCSISSFSSLSFQIFLPCWPLLHWTYVNASTFNAGHYWHYFSNVHSQTLVDKHIMPPLLKDHQVNTTQCQLLWKILLNSIENNEGIVALNIQFDTFPKCYLKSKLIYIWKVHENWVWAFCSAFCLGVNWTWK